jgi:hypothetical protein
VTDSCSCLPLPCLVAGRSLGGRACACRRTRFFGRTCAGLPRRAQNVAETRPVLVLIFRRLLFLPADSFLWAHLRRSSKSSSSLGANVPASQGELKTLLGRDRFVFFSSVALSFCRALTWVGVLPFAGGLVPSGAHASGSQGELKTLRRDRCLSLSAVAFSFCRALTSAGALPFSGDGVVS